MSRNVKITYFVHGTTLDNEKGLVTGWNPGKLSKRGLNQLIQLKKSINQDKFDFVFCSDLKRAIDTAKLIFGDNIQIIQDKRLRECNYGDFTGETSEELDSMVFSFIETPFPNGESLKEVEKRMREFLNDLINKLSGKKIAIVAHRFPQLALEVILRKRTWQQAIQEDWRLKQPKEWKLGWLYSLENEKPIRSN